MPRSTVTKRPLGMRESMYLSRLEWHLEGVVRASERKHILRSLREQISTDLRPVKVVLTDLGSPRTLALRYGEGERPRPLWQIGILTAATALMAYWVLFGVFTGGMLAAVDSAAPMSADATFLFVPVMAFSDDQGIGVGWTGGWEWLIVPLVIVAVALVVGARTWRLFHRDSDPKS
ncbi:hypothetical protein [Microbacterium sp. Leaf320]|uniref:hypothetical protein n=1 Tax=Microbacterium sp. Leaf320 TaxID=1736334 RepID=UPI0009E7F2E6|nr:hypothetical protein [Microbacterium sp. Leaf320]